MLLMIPSHIYGQMLPEHLSISGHAHSYYMYNTNNPTSGSNGNRLYDGSHDEFGFAISQLSLLYDDSKTSFVLDLNLGPSASLVNANSVGETSDVVQNAFIAHNLNDKFSVEFGKFGTHIGYEIIDATANMNYSTSYLFNYGPFYHVGGRVRYAMTDKYSLMVALYNNWDDLVDNNHSKTLGASFGFEPSENLSGSLNWIGGPEGTIRPNGNVSDFRSLFDLVMNYQITPDFLLGFNGVYGTDNESWYGAAAYFNYVFNQGFAATLRGEYFSDDTGIRGLGTSVTALTLTGEFKLGDLEHLFLKPEIKYDLAETDLFEGNTGAFNKRSQTTAGFAMLFKF